VDETVLFKPLTMEEVTRIVDLQIRELRGRLEARHLGLKVPENVEETIARRAYDPVYGARPLKRFVQQGIETPIARRLIAGELNDGDTVEVRIENGEITVHAG